MTSTEARKRAHVEGDYADYWLRSPNAGNSSYYIWKVTADGSFYGYDSPKTKLGVLIEISF